MNVLTRDTFTLIMLVKLFRAIVICRHALPGMGADDLRDCYPFGRRLIGARIGGFVDGSTEILRDRTTTRYIRDTKGKAWADFSTR